MTNNFILFEDDFRFVQSLYRMNCNELAHYKLNKTLDN